MKNLRRVTLELSSKPFVDDSEDTARGVAEHLFTQWLPLLREADEVAVLLWTSDGNELLTWSGNEEDTFEWAYWIGVAAPSPAPPNLTEREKMNTHLFPKKYREDAAPRSFRWLRQIIAILRERGKAITEKKILIGTTFDNGPEFAISDFKYKWHREILIGSTAGKNRTVGCTAHLHADTRHYAAFPDGIPEGLSFGSFLGAQYREFARHFDIDYLWLSNGMGFGRNTWGITGVLFDKERFNDKPKNVRRAHRAMCEFWRDLKVACPDILIETRGSNFSAGVEIASDAAPFDVLYQDERIAPPVNSPWAALNYNSGLELAAWMSHIAKLPPSKRIPFRYYIHDPWFLNSPWLDRYEQSPWDLYQPMAISRLSADGGVETANTLAFLSADDSFGRMPDQVPNEVIPHILEAWRSAPDAAGPLVWLYPFDEYSALVKGNSPDLNLLFFSETAELVLRNLPGMETILREDLFIGEALQNGLPLNTVISTEEFRGNPAVVQGRILIVPASALTEENESALHQFLSQGGKMMIYGSTDFLPPPILGMLGLDNDKPLVGKVTVTAEGMEADSQDAYVHALYNEGGLRAVPAKNGQAMILAEAMQNDAHRVLVAVAGNLAFVEAVLPMPEHDELSSYNLTLAAPGTVFPTAALPMLALKQFGWRFDSKGTMPPRTTISRHDNAFIFTVFSRDTSVDLEVSTPLGMPLLTGQETCLRDGKAVWRPGRCFRHECRAFVNMENGVVGVRKIRAAYPEYTDRRLITGLRDATVHFFPPPGSIVEFLHQEPQCGDFLHGTVLEPTWHDSPEGRYATLEHITGKLLVSW